MKQEQIIEWVENPVTEHLLSLVEILEGDWSYLMEEEDEHRDIPERE
jgi:hypothetical protein